MGCCESKNLEKSPEIFQACLKSCIKSGNSKQLSYTILSYNKSPKIKFDINQNMLDEEFGEINLLAYSLYQGRADMFKFIHKSLNADLTSMESLLDLQGKSGLSIICESNFLELFDYYAPLYFIMQKSQKKGRKRLKETIEFSEKYDKIIEIIENPKDCTYTPIQRACFNGHIGMVGAAAELGKKMEVVPMELDVNYIDDQTGDNCALIACKTGNYNMIKFLHSTHSCDFSILNKSQENALQILAASARVRHLSEFLPCFTYLIDKVNVDFTYNYQETLLLLEYEKVIDYFLNKLASIGIKASKAELETQESKKLEKLCRAEFEEGHEKFTLLKMFPELEVNSNVSNVSMMSALDTSNPSIVF